jgi:hypothetical protein
MEETVDLVFNFSHLVEFALTNGQSSLFKELDKFMVGEGKVNLLDFALLLNIQVFNYLSMSVSRFIFITPNLVEKGETLSLFSLV